MPDLEDMQVWVLSSVPSNGPTGVQTFIRNLETTLASSGIKTRLMTPRDFSLTLHLSIRAASVLFARFPATSFAVRRFVITYYGGFVIRRTLARSIGKVFICAQDPGLAHAAARAKAAKRLKARVRVGLVTHFNVDEYMEAKTKLGFSRNVALAHILRRNIRTALRQADYVVFPSEHSQVSIEQRYGAATGLRRIIRNFLAADPPHRRAPHERRLLNIGTLEERKNQRESIEIVRNLNDQGISCHLTLVGEGPDRAALEEEVMISRHSSQFAFIGQDPDGAERLDNADVLLHSSWLENMPLTLIESLAYARPIIARASGGVSEIVEHGVNGYTYTDPTDAVNHIKNLLDDPNLYGRISAAARDTFEEKFSVTYAKDRWTSLLSDVFAAPRVRNTGSGRPE